MFSDSLKKAKAVKEKEGDGQAGTAKPKRPSRPRVPKAPASGNGALADLAAKVAKPAKKRASKTAGKTKPVAICVGRSGAQGCINLYDSWRATNTLEIPAGAEKLRESLNVEKTNVFYLGASVPVSTWRKLESIGKKQDRKRNWVAAWCIEKGVKKLRLSDLKKAYEDQSTPTLSLTVVKVLEKGLEAWETEHAE